MYVFLVLKVCGVRKPNALMTALAMGSAVRVVSACAKINMEGVTARKTPVIPTRKEMSALVMGYACRSIKMGPHRSACAMKDGEAQSAPSLSVITTAAVGGNALVDPASAKMGMMVKSANI